ncbi:hypothetical protein BCU68_00135 [Vibrio sp. 10N.286.49.B3]|uniref:DUF2835 domain-containing protein n=1 Tax=Vibrio sp. 10N.286.49.B3 TaxID=1880855 RepID=UPI000C862804|nr:DUF2835 domain-containing protein [Vibrio sp. 10N.286.49.B3]PMH46497.1 hypothetical protein BCU68_00135 [Vibrio sp. 10N.286.49.B3]
MKYHFFRLNISYQAFLAHYSGRASYVQVTTEEGLSLKLPAFRFRPLLTHRGIEGRFKLTTDVNNKFLRLEMI